MMRLRPRKPRKGPGLAPHIPMPDGAPDPAAQPQGLSDADRAALEHAARTAGIAGPAARSRGLHLAAAVRENGGSVEDWLPVLHRLVWAQGHGGTGSSWAHVVATLLVACHELDPASGPVSDEQADVLARAVLDGEEL